MANTNFLKVIYFGEVFVTDFLQLIADGELKKTTEFLTELQGEIGAEANAGTEKKGVMKLLSAFSGIDVNTKPEASGAFSYKRGQITGTTA